MRSRTKEEKNQKKKCNPPHHILPSSRGGSNDELNKIYPPLDLHVQYHILFGNWTPEEIIEKLRVFWSSNDAKMSQYFNKSNKQKAYKTLFGNKNNKEIERCLEEDWFNPVISFYGFFRKDP